MGMAIEGDKALSRRFRSMAGRAEDVEEAWPKVGQYLSRAVNRQFSTEGQYFGTPWKPLKSEYKLWKLRHGFPGKILVRTGVMKKSLTSRPMDIEIYRGNSAEFGTRDRKAVWHNYGTHRHGKRVNPARKILVATRQVRSDVRDIIANYVTRGMQ